MTNCLFCSDLHGDTGKYDKLFSFIIEERPSAVLLGGDLLPGPVQMMASDFLHKDFVNDILFRGFKEVQAALGSDYPDVFIILGNDDGRFEELTMLDAATRGAWHYVHGRGIPFGPYTVYGYSYVPPTPFRLKDWERYDVSRYVDPGCVHPEDGTHSVPVPLNELRYSTISEDLNILVGGDDLSRAIMLFHSPPYDTALDRAALDGKIVDHVPLDVHVGSIAIQRFIRKYQPMVTLHGHIHESVRLTGVWKERLGNTWMFGGAHDGPELAIIRFDAADPELATRELI